MKTFKKSSAGFSIMEVAIALGVGSVIALGVAMTLGWSAQNQANSMTLSQLFANKLILMKALGNTQAWKNTINDPANHSNATQMECLVKGTPCAASVPPELGGVGRTFKLLGPGPNYSSAATVYDSTIPSAGLTDKGVPCNSFMPSPDPGRIFNGTDNCPFRYEMQWYAICSGATCTNPTVLVNAKLLYNPSPDPANDKAKRRLVADLDRYSINSYFIGSGPCDTQSKIFQAGEVGTFTMPPYNIMWVEVWGGGGGATGGGAPFGAWVKGTDGTASTFGPITAPGGLSVPVGSGPMFGAGAWWFITWMPAGPLPLPGSSGPWNGYSPPAAATPPSNLVSSCTVAIKSGVGGAANWWVGGNGTTPGGGGGGSIGWSGYVPVAFAFEPTPGAGAGTYVATPWTNGAGGPAPGTPLAYSVGVGGKGGRGQYGIGPPPTFPPGWGGDGGDGLIRITWR